MKTITVIPLKKGFFKNNLTYFSLKNIPEGSIVNINLRGKNILGLSIASEEVTDVKSEIKNLNFELKKISEIKGKSVFREEYLESVMLASRYFATSKNLVATSFIPSAFREEYDKIAKLKNKTEITFKKTISKIKPEKLLFQASFSDRISFYKTFIRESFARKKSVFIVLPTENDIETYNQALSKGIENFIFTLHGGLTTKKQVVEFDKIIASEHPVLILGTAPYLSIPRYDVETIILENENSNAYRTMSRNSLDLRIFTEIFSNKIGAKLIIASTMLRFETIAKKDLEGWGEIRPLSYRVNNENTEIEIVEKKKISTSEKQERFRILSEKSLKEIKEKVLKNERVFIFALRKGLATTTVCHDCGEILLCEKCSAPVVLYFSKNRERRIFICNKCGNEKSTETTCKNCGSWNLIPLGIGTDTVFEEIKKNFPENEIFKLDKDSVKTQKQAKKIISDFEKSTGSILIGTEMAFSYLKTKVPLSVIASFDSLWSVPNFRMSERIVQILISIISITNKKLIIETKNQKDSAIKYFSNENLLSFIRSELEDRKNLGYPPFQRLIKITFSGNKEETAKVRRFLSETFLSYSLEIFSGFIAKIKDKYITNAIIKIAPGKWSLPELSTDSQIDEMLFKKLISLPPIFSVNIDPEDLL